MISQVAEPKIDRPLSLDPGTVPTFPAFHVGPTMASLKFPHGAQLVVRGEAMVPPLPQILSFERNGELKLFPIKMIVIRETPSWIVTLQG